MASGVTDDGLLAGEKSMADLFRAAGDLGEEGLIHEHVARLSIVVHLAVFLTLTASIVPAGELFVATDGNDAWSGRLAEPDAAKSDGPFASLERARDEARQRKTTGPTTVRVRGGRYALSRPLEFTPVDSGDEGHPVSPCAPPRRRSFSFESRRSR